MILPVFFLELAQFMTAEFRVDNKIELLLHVWEKVVLMAMNREKGVQSKRLFHAIS